MISCRIRVNVENVDVRSILVGNVTVEDLLGRYAAGERDFTGVAVMETNLFGLSDWYFKGVNLSGAIFL